MVTMHQIDGDDGIAEHIQMHWHFGSLKLLNGCHFFLFSFQFCFVAIKVDCGFADLPNHSKVYIWFHLRIYISFSLFPFVKCTMIVAFLMALLHFCRCSLFCSLLISNRIFLIAHRFCFLFLSFSLPLYFVQFSINVKRFSLVPCSTLNVRMFGFRCAPMCVCLLIPPPK